MYFHPMPKNHPRLLLSSIVIILMPRLTLAQPEGKRVELAVWPEEEHGSRIYERVKRGYSF
jgi:hypothetical protein